MARSVGSSSRMGGDPASSNTSPNSKEETNKGNGYSDGEQYEFEDSEESKKKESKFKSAWAKWGVDGPTVILMMKSGLPPAIALAIYQADDVAKTYSTLGYLIAIISILGFCIMPRAKFIQTLVINIIATCVGSAVCLLMVWSGVQARLNTTPPGAPPQRYNSSQSAVCGVWLFFQIWLVNSLKAKFPQFVFPAIIYSIFVNVAAGYGPQFTTTAQATSFIRRLLESFLTGLGIATVVSLFIFPVTSRKVVTKGIKSYLITLRQTLQAHNDYLQSLETVDVFSKWRTMTGGDMRFKKPEIKPEIQALKRLNGVLTQLHGKLRADMPFAKREVAYGKFTPDDFEALFKRLRELMMLLIGLGSLVDLFERSAERMRWSYEPGMEAPDAQAEAVHRWAVSEWHDIMVSIHQPIASIMEAMDGGLAHVMLRFNMITSKELAKGGLKWDKEARGDAVMPGDKGFAEFLEKRSEDFYHGKEKTLRKWIETKGYNIKEDFFQEAATDPLFGMDRLREEPTDIHQRDQRQLYFLLYVVFLLHSVSLSILRLVQFADEKDLSTAKRKLILPGRKRFKKWVASAFSSTQETDQDDEATLAGVDQGSTIVYMGQAFRKQKDPEHLPPENAWERFGNYIRVIPRALRSSQSSFGFRVACATMTVAIVGFLHDSQTFFVKQRLVWALIMISISMTPTAGQSIWAFVLRIAGSAVATIIAWLVWYIPAEKTAGIIVFLWVFVSLGSYFVFKTPQFIIAAMIGVVTTTLIIGYELEVRKIGVRVAESNGQPAYPIYQLGPYRLATVVGGLLVAFIWTFFPFPISEHSALRHKLGAALYLSANYYSIVHETVMGRIRGDEGDPTDKQSPAYKLGKARHKVFAKQIMLIQGLRTHSSFVRWGLPIGGKFPHKEYDTITQLVANIMNYSALIAYASETFRHPAHWSEDGSDTSEEQWFQDFRRVVLAARLTSHEITSTLALLSSSIRNGQPLPPYLAAPQAYRLSKRMEQIDRDILSIRHIAEPGYAAFAVLQISTTCISMDLEKLLVAVKRLVGELDFSFHVVSTREHSVAPSTDARYVRDNQ